jgi:hypothetical protein
MHLKHQTAATVKQEKARTISQTRPMLGVLENHAQLYRILAKAAQMCARDVHIHMVCFAEWSSARSASGR